ncbi:hypothetical protein KKE03_03305 [Patescibacteria group bacterium]|nr:hypothetical protein [Patescibacteria group bacterium]
MNARELTLNIAVNLGRISRWAMEGKQIRISQFLEETAGYLKELENSPRNPRFEKTYQLFKNSFSVLKNNPKLNYEWAEDMLTWANILTHRSKLA